MTYYNKVQLRTAWWGMAGVAWHGFLQYCWTSHDCSFSSVLSCSSETTWSTRPNSVLITDLLFSNGWFDSQFKYCSVCVGFIYTWMFVDPSFCTVTLVSKRAIVLFSGSSMVNLMLLSMLLMCSVNSGTYFWRTEGVVHIIPAVTLQLVSRDPEGSCDTNSHWLPSPDEGREILPKIGDIFHHNLTLCVECVIMCDVWFQKHSLPNCF